MKPPYLEVTFRGGRAFAAYLHLPTGPGGRSFRTTQPEPGLLVDFGRDGSPVGIEILDPGRVTIAALNRVVVRLGLPKLRRADLAPLRAA